MLSKVRTSTVNPNVCSAISPLNFLAKGLGVLPFSLKMIDDRHTPVTSRRDAIYTVVFVIAYLVLVIHTMQKVETSGEKDAMVPQYTIIIESAMMVILMYSFIIFGYVFRRFIIKTLKRICVIDETFETVKIYMDYRKMEKWVYTKIVYIIISAIIRAILMINIMDIDFIQQLLLCFATFIKSVAKNQFVILVVQIRDRYIKINDTIQSLFMYKSSYVQVTANDTIRKITKMLYVLCRIHYKLRKIVQNIITAYAIQLLAYLGVALSNIIFQAYFLYALVTSTKTKLSFIYVASTIAWLVDEVFELYTLVKTCSETSNIAADTATILHQLRNNVKNMELESHVQMYSLQMLHQQIQFSALGFVTIDYSLLYSIIGAVTTYLVILIQFDQAQLSIANSRMQQANLANMTNALLAQNASVM